MAAPIVVIESCGACNRRTGYPRGASTCGLPREVCSAGRPSRRVGVNDYLPNYRVDGLPTGAKLPKRVNVAPEARWTGQRGYASDVTQAVAANRHPIEAFCGRPAGERRHVGKTSLTTSLPAKASPAPTAAWLALQSLPLVVPA
jgi:hypothetical protein